MTLRFSPEEAQEKIDHYGLIYRKKVTIEATMIAEDFEVQTMEGVMKGRAGDYLANNSLGKQSTPWIIRKEVLAETYEKAR